MRTLARSLFLDSEIGAVQELPHAGSALENPFVYHDAAQELKALATQGLVEILDEHSAVRFEELLIDRLRFKRLR